MGIEIIDYRKLVEIKNWVGKIKREKRMFWSFRNIVFLNFCRRIKIFINIKMNL